MDSILMDVSQLSWREAIMGWTHVCGAVVSTPGAEVLLWKRTASLQKVLQVWSGLALGLRVSEVQLTMQRTSSAHPPPTTRGHTQAEAATRWRG